MIEVARGRLGRPQHAHLVGSAGAYRAAAQRHLVATGRAPLLFDGGPAVAFVNHGRWVCLCSVCGYPETPVASPEWRLAICFRCGAVYWPTFPPFLADLEAALLARPDPATRNWEPTNELARLLTHERGQTLSDVWAANEAHGIAAGRGT